MNLYLACSIIAAKSRQRKRERDEVQTKSRIFDIPLRLVWGKVSTLSTGWSGVDVRERVARGMVDKTVSPTLSIWTGSQFRVFSGAPLPTIDSTLLHRHPSSPKGLTDNTVNSVTRVKGYTSIQTTLEKEQTGNRLGKVGTVQYDSSTRSWNNEKGKSEGKETRSKDVSGRRKGFTRGDFGTRPRYQSLNGRVPSYPSVR